MRRAGLTTAERMVPGLSKRLLWVTPYTLTGRLLKSAEPQVKKFRNVKVLDHGGETSTPTWSYRGSASNPASYAVGAGWFVRTSENFEQSIVVDGIGAGQRTVCISATIRPSGEYNASERC